MKKLIAALMILTSFSTFAAPIECEELVKKGVNALAKLNGRKDKALEVTKEASSNMMGIRIEVYTISVESEEKYVSTYKAKTVPHGAEKDKCEILAIGYSNQID
jgi:hypothetical protein